ncbi:MAG: homocysteine S-methyltransferase [Gammaproteobacteria bacterium]|nr:homocysteine S-methyltransferase [Gammaproteobacteria bacterium]
MTTSAKSRFVERLQQPKPVLLDGGLATQLESQGCDLDNNLWSAALLSENPEEILTAHDAYLVAGAEVLATASYQASTAGFRQYGIGTRDADRLMRLSVDLAVAASQKNASEALVAASLGPYGAMLHDGSEYHGNYGVGATAVRNYHAPRIALFDATAADVLAFETIPSRGEAQVLADLLRDVQTPAWISFSCKDESHISDGTPLRDVASLFSQHPTVKAVGINCTAPQFAPRLVETIRKSAPDKYAMAYPNSGESYNADSNSWSGTVTPLDCAAAAREWIAAGAHVIGGCCRMGPGHIRAMCAVLN